MYVIVFNMLENSRNVMEYWLKAIRQLTPDKPPIFLVGTHADQVDSLEMQQSLDADIRSFLSKFPKQNGYNIINFFAVSCKTGQGVKELKDNILQYSLQHTIFPYVPSTYIQVYDLILKEKQDPNQFLLEWAYFSSLAKMCAITDPEEIVSVSQFLHDIGMNSDFFFILKTKKSKKIEELFAF